ncbi:MAG: Abi family protein [Saccharofermentanales bacterium]
MDQQTNEVDCKKFRNLDEQINILKSRGLVIEDEIKAKEFLYNNNYYRVSGYSLTLRNHDKFYPNTKFQNIIDIYNYDQELRNLLLKYLEIIEIKIKSIYTYEFSKKHGGIGYLDSNRFFCNDTYKSKMYKSNYQVEKRKSHEAYLKHFIEELKTPIPMWAYIDLLTIMEGHILCENDSWVQIRIIRKCSL